MSNEWKWKHETLFLMINWKSNEGKIVASRSMLRYGRIRDDKIRKKGREMIKWRFRFPAPSPLLLMPSSSIIYFFLKKFFFSNSYLARIVEVSPFPIIIIIIIPDTKSSH